MIKRWIEQRRARKHMKMLMDDAVTGIHTDLNYAIAGALMKSLDTEKTEEK